MFADLYAVVLMFATLLAITLICCWPAFIPVLAVCKACDIISSRMSYIYAFVFVFVVVEPVVLSVVVSPEEPEPVSLIEVMYAIE